jgi:digeranylgeranylglycerophospholipid reductase
LQSNDLARFGITLSGAYEVNAGTIPSEPYSDKMLYGNVIRVGDSANFATPTVGEGIRIAIKFGRLLGPALARALARNDRSGLVDYEVQCKKTLKTNYYFGYVANKKIATYAIDEWDASVRRLSRLTEYEITCLLRSEFPAKMAFRVIWRNVWRKLAAKLSRKAPTDHHDAA